MYSIRPATPDDAKTIIAHRRGMFLDMGYRDQQKLDAMTKAFGPWLDSRIVAGEYVGWLAMAADGSVAAGLGVWLMDWPPHAIGGGSRRGNIINVYTEAAHRRRGLARLLMNTALEWCRANQADVVILHTSEDGRRLYESLGFEPTNEMRMVLD